MTAHLTRRGWIAVAACVVALLAIGAAASTSFDGPTHQAARMHLRDAAAVAGDAIGMPGTAVQTTSCRRTIGAGRRSSVRAGGIGVEMDDRADRLERIASAWREVGLDVVQEDLTPPPVVDADGVERVGIRQVVGTVTAAGDGFHLQATARARADGTAIILTTGRTDCLR